MTTTETVCFKITGEFVTRHCRDLWVEGSYDAALRFLEVSLPSMPRSNAEDVITGKSKLVGVNDLCLEADNATEHRGMKLLSVREAFAKVAANQEAERLEKRVLVAIANEDYVVMASPWGRLKVPRPLTIPNPKRSYRGVTRIIGMDWDEFERRYHGIVQDAIDEREAAKSLESTHQMLNGMRRELNAAEANEKAAIDRGVSPLLALIDPALMPAAQALFAAPLKEPPPVDREMASPNGWLSPDGKFYPCGFMGHVRLAAVLHKDGEPGLERAWVKIQDSHDPQAIIARYKAPGSDFAHIPTRGVTQAQLNAMQRWCDKHGRQLPPELEVR